MAPPGTPFQIFISYRRQDSSGHAGRLYDRLSAHFGEENVFMDVDNLKGGDDFEQVIRSTVSSCTVLLAVIGQDWLTVADERGRRRLDNPHDFVRVEIATALARGILVIPVLVQGARPVRAEDLPGDLAGLARKHAVDLSDTRWAYDVGRLIERLDRKHAEIEDVRGSIGIETGKVVRTVPTVFSHSPRSSEESIPVQQGTLPAKSPSRPVGPYRTPALVGNGSRGVSWNFSRLEERLLKALIAVCIVVLSAVIGSGVYYWFFYTREIGNPIVYEYSYSGDMPVCSGFFIRITLRQWREVIVPHKDGCSSMLWKFTEVKRSKDWIQIENRFLTSWGNFEDILGHPAAFRLPVRGGKVQCTDESGSWKSNCLRVKEVPFDSAKHKFEG